MSITFPTTNLKVPSGITALPSGAKRPGFGTLYGFDAQQGGGSAGGFNELSLRFDGTDDMLKATASLVSKTISIWFKPDSVINASSSRAQSVGLGTTEAGVNFGGGASQLTDELIWISDGYRYWGYTSSSDSITAEWHHVVCVWNTGSSSTNSGNPGYDIYLDGVSKGNAFGNHGIYGNGNFITSNRVTQGNFARESGGTACYFDGLLDELAIWDASLSATDVTAIYNGGNGATDLLLATSYDTDRTSNLIGYWRNGDGDEAVGGAIVYDMSVNGSTNNLAMINTPEFEGNVP